MGCGLHSKIVYMALAIYQEGSGYQETGVANYAFRDGALQFAQQWQTAWNLRSAGMELSTISSIGCSIGRASVVTLKYLTGCIVPQSGILNIIMLNELINVPILYTYNYDLEAILLLPFFCSLS